MLGELIKSLFGKTLDKSKTIKTPKSLPPIEPLKWMKIGQEVGQLIRKQGRFPEEKVFFEAPTGPAPILPLAYWLMGSKQVITADLNHDFDVDYLIQNLNAVCQHKTEVETIFGEHLKKPRFYELIEMMDHPFHMQKFLELTQIDYWAPADVCDIALPNSSIDFHITSSADEADLKRQTRILTEANRLLKPQGLLIDWAEMSVDVKSL